MVKVLFFASIRDRVGCSELEVALPERVCNVAELTNLILQQGEVFNSVLSAQKYLVAVNQEMATPEMPVKNGDEIAYFPPVTGG